MKVPKKAFFLRFPLKRLKDNGIQLNLYRRKNVKKAEKSFKAFQLIDFRHSKVNWIQFRNQGEKIDC